MEQQYFVSNGESIRATFPHSVQFGFDLVKLNDRNFSWRALAESLLGWAVLIACSPVYIACALAVKLSSRGPVFYCQERVGSGGEPFTIYKFRTMQHNAEAQTGAVLSVQNDPRLTSIGRFLRNSHLDELPQILNIIKGDMSFIGPRPERTVFVRKFNEQIPLYTYRTTVKPGVTGLAQVCCSYDASAADKLEFDLLYVRHRNSLQMNLMILSQTLKKVFLVRYNV